MNNLIRITIFIIFISPLLLSASQYPDPVRFASDIAAFERIDTENGFSEGCVVCVGSSSMRLWKNITDDLSPLKIIHRGFGGSTMNDVLFYTEKLVLKYKPRAVVLYEGDNDIAAGITPETIRKVFLNLVQRIHGALPNVRIYVISIKPSESRWNLWERTKKANSYLAYECSKNPLLRYVDITRGMFTDTGALRTDLFSSDKLHMNRRGYEVWRNILRPVLMEKEFDE